LANPKQAKLLKISDREFVPFHLKRLYSILVRMVAQSKKRL